MKNYRFQSINISLDCIQVQWLSNEANRRMLNRSALVREAIELLKKEYKNGETQDRK